MATHEINAYGAEVRARDIGFVLLMHTITLGLYNYYWYYKINRELRDFGRVYGLQRCGSTNPWRSLLAVSVGALVVVPAIVSWYRCTKRIQEAQGVVSQKPVSGVALAFSFISGFLLVLTLLVVPYLVQAALNGVWLAFREVDPETGRSPERIRISIGALEGLPAARAWDLSRLGDEQLAAIGGFLADRERLGPAARSTRSQELGRQVSPLVPDAPAELEGERLLELVYAASDLNAGGGGAPVS